MIIMIYDLIYGTVYNTITQAIHNCVSLWHSQFPQSSHSFCVYLCRCNPIHRYNWSSTSRTSYHCWWPLSYDCRYCIVSFRNGKYCISSKRQLTIASTSCTVVFIVYVTFIWRLHCHYDIPFSDNRMQEMITAWGMHETIDPLAIDLIQQILRPNPNER